MTIEWRQIPGLAKGYEASACGKVRNPKGRVLRPIPNRQRSLKYNVYADDGRPTTRTVKSIQTCELSPCLPVVPGERWQLISGYEDYFVSSSGRVWSLLTGKLLKAGTTKHGYAVVNLKGDPKQVHTLVMGAFVGARPPGNVIRHLNDRKADNRLANLSYGTQRENMADAKVNKVRSGKRSRRPESNFVLSFGC